MDVSNALVSVESNKRCQCSCKRRMSHIQNSRKEVFTSGQSDGKPTGPIQSRPGGLATEHQPYIRGRKNLQRFTTTTADDQSCISKHKLCRDNNRNKNVILGYNAECMGLWNICIWVAVLSILPSICSGRVIFGESLPADDNPHQLVSAARRRGDLDEVVSDNYSLISNSIINHWCY